MHSCISKLTINGSDNGLSPGRHQTIHWTNAGILWIRTLWSLNSYIFIQENALENVTWKMAAILSRSHCVNMHSSILLMDTALGLDISHLKLICILVGPAIHCKGTILWSSNLAILYRWHEFINIFCAYNVHIDTCKNKCLVTKDLMWFYPSFQEEFQYFSPKSNFEWYIKCSQYSDMKMCK